MTALPIREARAYLTERITGARIGAPIELNVTMDESWSPYIQGDLTIPRRLLDDLEKPAGSVKLGKLQADYLTLELETRYGRGRSCADYTAAMLESRAALLALIRTPAAPWHPGEPIRPLSAATALWGGRVASVTLAAGGDTAAITMALRQPGGSYRIPPTERRTIRVRRRRETPHDLDGTVTITFSGEDVRLQDYRHTGTTAYVNLYTRLRPLVADVLGKISATMPAEWSVQLLGGGDVAIATGQEWKPAQRAYDFLHPILEAAGWTLYADTNGVYRLEPRTSRTAPRDLDANRDLIDFELVRDRGNQYFDGAMVEYTDADPLNPAQRWEVFTYSSSQRITHETRPGIRTMTGAAENLVQRSLGRSTPGTAEATVQLDLEPRHRPAIRTPWRTWHGTISALTHSYPDAETHLEFRDIITE